jgi:hypothetical protein
VLTSVVNSQAGNKEHRHVTYTGSGSCVLPIDEYVFPEWIGGKKDILRMKILVTQSLRRTCPVLDPRERVVFHPLEL